MANMNSLFQVEMRRNGRQIVGIVVHVVAVGGLSGAAVPTTIMRDNPIAALQEEQHLVIPVVRAKRPTMAENHGLSFSPVLVVDLYPVFGSDCRHEPSLLSSVPHCGKPRRH